MSDTELTDLEGLLQRLIRAGQKPERALLDQIKAFGPVAIDPLIAIAIDEDLHFADQARPEIWAPLHAIQLLGELRAPEAIQPLLPLFAWDDDWLEEALPECFGQIGEPALASLREFLFDETKDFYARVRAGAGLVKIAERYSELRPDVVAVFVDWLAQAKARTADDKSFNGFVVGYLLDLKARETEPAIQQAFEQGIVDRSIVGPESIRIEFHGEDPAKVFPNWRLPGMSGVGAGGRTGAHLAAVPASAPRAARKIGRNDPCPCGSGNKYKRCCGR